MLYKTKLRMLMATVVMIPAISRITFEGRLQDWTHFLIVLNPNRIESRIYHPHQTAKLYANIPSEINKIVEVRVESNTSDFEVRNTELVLTSSPESREKNTAAPPFPIIPASIPPKRDIIRSWKMSLLFQPVSTNKEVNSLSKCVVFCVFTCTTATTVSRVANIAKHTKRIRSVKLHLSYNRWYHVPLIMHTATIPSIKAIRGRNFVYLIFSTLWLCCTPAKFLRVQLVVLPVEEMSSSKSQRDFSALIGPNDRVHFLGLTRCKENEGMCFKESL